MPGTIVRRIVASNTFLKYFSTPIPVLSSPTQLSGSRLISVEIDYEVTILALTDLAIVVYRITRGADGSPATVATEAFTYDAGHDTDAERSAVKKHRLTATLTSPPWIDNDQYVVIYLQFHPQVTSQFWFSGMFANYYWRD